MKKDALCMKHLKQLLAKARKAGGRAEFHETNDIMEFLLWSILTTYASESRAVAAISKLQAALVDYNELRVSPVAEIVEVVGADFPYCRPAAEEIARTLHAVFNRLHNLNLDFLKTSPRRTAETFISTLDGIGPHAKAMMILRCLKGHAVPLDVNMYLVLQKSGCIPADISTEPAQRWLASRIKERDIPAFYGSVKRYAAAHAPRKIVLAPAPTAPTPKPAPTVADAGARPQPIQPVKAEAARKEPPLKKPKPKESAQSSRGRKGPAVTAGNRPAPKPSPTKSRAKAR
jgi:endonuclease III